MLCWWLQARRPNKVRKAPSACPPDPLRQTLTPGQEDLGPTNIRHSDGGCLLRGRRAPVLVRDHKDVVASPSLLPAQNGAPLLPFLGRNFENTDEDLSVASSVESLWSTRSTTPFVKSTKGNDLDFQNAVLCKLGLQVTSIEPEILTSEYQPSGKGVFTANRCVNLGRPASSVAPRGCTFLEPNIQLKPQSEGSQREQGDLPDQWKNTCFSYAEASLKKDGAMSVGSQKVSSLDRARTGMVDLNKGDERYDVTRKLFVEGTVTKRGEDRPVDVSKCTGVDGEASRHMDTLNDQFYERLNLGLGDCKLVGSLPADTSLLSRNAEALHFAYSGDSNEKYAGQVNNGRGIGLTPKGDDYNNRNDRKAAIRKHPPLFSDTACIYSNKENTLHLCRSSDALRKMKLSEGAAVSDAADGDVLLERQEGSLDQTEHSKIEFCGGVSLYSKLRSTPIRIKKERSGLGQLGDKASLTSRVFDSFQRRDEKYSKHIEALTETARTSICMPGKVTECLSIEVPTSGATNNSWQNRGARFENERIRNEEAAVRFQAVHSENPCLELPLLREDRPQVGEGSCGSHRSDSPRSLGRSGKSSTTERKRACSLSPHCSEDPLKVPSASATPAHRVPETRTAIQDIRSLKPDEKTIGSPQRSNSPERELVFKERHPQKHDAPCSSFPPQDYKSCRSFLQRLRDTNPEVSLAYGPLFEMEYERDKLPLEVLERLLKLEDKGDRLGTASPLGRHCFQPSNTADMLTCPELRPLRLQNQEDLFVPTLRKNPGQRLRRSASDVADLPGVRSMSPNSLVDMERM